MDTQLFQAEAKKITARRPVWQFVIEDNILRVLTHQFQAEWGIINEMLDDDKNLEILEVTSHNQYGIVITFRCNLGT